MPELPEVETTRRGIAPLVKGKIISAIIVRQPSLRWRVPEQLSTQMKQHEIVNVTRRAKYLLFSTTNGTIIIHLGMSGSLRVIDTGSQPGKHDHVEIQLNNGKSLRLRDPRRFGAVLWTRDDPVEHKLLRKLGIEPLDKKFTGEYLFGKARNKKLSIKNLIMDSHVVVGVGNIYANEALFLAGIRPRTASKRLSRVRMEKLVDCIKDVLKKAIKQGGSSIRDFTRSDGKPGYFQQQLNVYNRAGLPCFTCGNPILLVRQNQRASYFCKFCQT